ncbi:hypothetical protein DYB34_006545 [Aphanomyces astaci]|uniref:Uncharacterized protein n=1 Tax=Aphanomyces astaci TaxID=112090 RepID=A0A418C9K6_APHAT|nr:hypothetical protein DYB34_006545 [Aphanomyces astaci]
MVILDHRFRGFIAAETSRASLLCITLMCAKTSVDVATSNGDATPLHTLFKPFADPTTLADMVWTSVAAAWLGLVLRLAMHSVVTFAGLVLEWQRASTLDQLTTRLAFYFTPRLPGTILLFSHRHLSHIQTSCSHWCQCRPPRRRPVRELV